LTTSKLEPSANSWVNELNICPKVINKLHSAQDPGLTLLRYDRNGDGLTSEKWSMYDRNADENGQKFRQVRYCVGTNVTVGWEVRSTMGTNVVNLGRQIFI